MGQRFHADGRKKRGDDDSVKDLLRLKNQARPKQVCLFHAALCFIALGIRIGWLQLGFNTEFLQKQGAMRFQRTIEVPAMRGQIYDRNGTLLATSVTAKALWIIPQDVQNFDLSAQRNCKDAGHSAFRT